MSEAIEQLRVAFDARLWFYTLVGTVLALVAGFIIARFGVVGIAAMALVPIVMAVVVAALIQPRIGLIIYLQLCFIVNGLFRVVPVTLPYGMMADAALVLSLLGVLLNARRMDWKQLKSPIFYLVIGWFVYTVLLIFNPLSPYTPAWIFAVRAISLYWVQVTMLSLLLFKTRKDIELLIRLWLMWSVLAALWAFKQQYIGLTPGEIQWLNAGAAKTHMLFGHLRSFSFYSDAGQFGAEMAYATLLATIRLLEEKGFWRKLIYAVLAVTLFWGYAVSGTRGALSVLLVGLPLYALLRGNIGLLVAGVFLAGSLFGILKFTSIGGSNYQIHRMRTALDPDDESFQVRLENQRKLDEYMSDKPFGVGIGTSGDWGRRFAPGSFLAETPPDSWLVKIWIETGLVGLLLFSTVILSAFIIGYLQIVQLKDQQMKIAMASFLAGFLGICVASYGNPIFGQFPTNSIMYISISIFTTCVRFEKNTAHNVT